MQLLSWLASAWQLSIVANNQKEKCDYMMHLPFHWDSWVGNPISTEESLSSLAMLNPEKLCLDGWWEWPLAGLCIMSEISWSNMVSNVSTIVVMIWRGSQGGNCTGKTVGWRPRTLRSFPLLLKMRKSSQHAVQHSFETAIMSRFKFWTTH